MSKPDKNTILQVIILQKDCLSVSVKYALKIHEKCLNVIIIIN